MALNIKLKDTQGIAKNRLAQQEAAKPNPVRDTIMYGGTVRGSRASMDGKSVYELSNKNAILNDRWVQQIASPTQMWRTATQWRKNPSFVADRPQKGTYTWDGRYKQITSPWQFDIQWQIRAQNQGIINPPTDIQTPETPTSLDEMYQGAMWVRKPTKADGIRAELEAKKLEQEQKLQAEKDNLSIIEQTEYLKKTKEQEDYMKQQRALQEEQDRISEEQIKVNEDRQLKDASDSISRLRQNLGFLWGSNSVSQQALDSAGRQLSNMTSFYADLKYLNELGGRARSNQYESVKNNFNRDMKLLQDDLDSKVDKVIQSAFNGITAADISGQMDTVEEVNQMRMRILDSIDQDVASVTRGEIQKRQMLLEQYTQLLEDEKERVTLSNTVNTELSAVRGYYVDGNGEAFIDAETMLPIKVPKEPPMPPQYIKETGQLLTFSYDENGNIVGNMQQVVDVPQFSDKTIKVTNVNWEEETYQFNVATGKYDIPVGSQQANQQWQTILNEPIVDTGIISFYGSPVKLKQSVASMLEQANGNLQQQGITLQIADNYMSEEVKNASFNAWKPGNVSWADSFHTKWQAIDLVQSAEMNNETVFQALRDAGFQQLPWEWWHWSVGEMSPVTGDGITDPLTWVPMWFAQRIRNMVPPTLRNSDAEQANLTKMIKSLHSSWLEATDAALLYMWFDVNSNIDKEFAKNLIYTSFSLPEDTDPSFITNISDLVNQGRYDDATKKMENAVLSYAKKAEWDNFISEAKVKTATQRAKTIEDFVWGLPNSPVGVVEGSIQKWLGKLKWADAQRIATDITQLVSQMRNDLIGSSATAGEVQMLSPLIPDLNDTPANFMIKLNNLRKQPLLEHNNIRTSYSMPTIDEATLLSNSKAQLYRGWSTSRTNTQTQGVVPVDEIDALLDDNQSTQ